MEINTINEYIILLWVIAINEAGSDFCIMVLDLSLIEDNSSSLSAMLSRLKIFFCDSTSLFIWSMLFILLA